MNKPKFLASLLRFLLRWQNTLFHFGMGFALAPLPFAYLLHLEAEASS